ncbi:DHA2 family efflux MFS transporter permease subunit [Candidatus Thorarchaeota archaeon]|nr:MAG: DHA2 family efflux MFS transporter permease subunit [Candidatus Thorarchaeota archaeon]
MNRTQLGALAVATAASFLTPFMSSAMNIALPTIGAQFAADAVTLSWVATSYLLAAAMFLVPFGRLADIKGRKRVFIAGIAVYTIASLLCALSNTIEFLIAMRVLQGIGGSMIFGTGVAILVSVFPPNEKGKVLGLNVAAVYIGLSLGPTIGGVMTKNLGWRSIFLANIPVGLVALILAVTMLDREWADTKGEQFDIIGSALYGGMLALLMYGLSEFPDGTHFIIGGTVLLVVFVAWELRNQSPVLDIGLFVGNRTYAFSNLAALLNYAATFGVGFLMSLFMQYVMGMDSQEAGLILVFQPLFQALFSPLAGRLSDRIQPVIVASAGMALTALSLFFFSLIDSQTTILSVIANLILLGSSLALFSSPNMNAVMSSVSRDCFGVASSTVSTMRLVGQMSSMALITLIFNLIIGRVQITPAVTPALIVSTQAIFLIFAVLCVLGTFASGVRGTVTRDEESR